MTSGTLTGSFEGLLEVVDKLVAMEREAAGTAPAAPQSATAGEAITPAP